MYSTVQFNKKVNITLRKTLLDNHKFSIIIGIVLWQWEGLNILFVLVSISEDYKVSRNISHTRLLDYFQPY